MRMYQIVLATTIAAIVVVDLSSMATTAQTQPFRGNARDRNSEPKRTPELMILAQGSSKNNNVAESLNSAASLFESIAKLAITGESDSVANKLRTVVAAVDKLKGLVPGPTFRNVNDRLSDMREAQKNGDFEGITLAAADGYRTMRLAQDPALLPAPIDVYMLEYTGLKTMALAQPDSPGWRRIAAIGDETSNYWTEISPKVKQTALRSLMDLIISGIKRAVADQNVSNLRFVIKLQLDAVDLLKADFIPQ